MTLCDRMRSHWARAVVTRCEDQGCEMRLDGIKEHVVLKGEQLSRDRFKMCDNLVFAEIPPKVIVGAVELKSNTTPVGEIIEKLDNGAREAAAMLSRCGQSSSGVSFYPIALAKSWHSADVRKLARSRVRFNGRPYPISSKRCGTHLSQIID
jgi:hypothetical protein